MIAKGLVLSGVTYWQFSLYDIETLSDCLYLLVILFQTAAVIAVSPFTIIALFMPLCPVYRLIKQFVNEIMQKNFIDKLLFKQPKDDNKDKIKWK